MTILQVKMFQMELFQIRIFSKFHRQPKLQVTRKKSNVKIQIKLLLNFQILIKPKKKKKNNKLRKIEEQYIEPYKFENVPYQIVTQLSLIQELNRGQEFPEHDIHDFAQSLDELEGDIINSWISDVFQNNQRIIRFENERFRVVDNFLPGHPPHRALVMRDSMAYSQTEVLLVNTNADNVEHVSNKDNVEHDGNADSVVIESGNWQIQHSGFVSKGHQCMSFGVPLLAKLNMHKMCDIEDMQFKSLVIGGAGCCVPLTLAAIFKRAEFEVVEIDEEIADIAHNFFGAPKPHVQILGNSPEELEQLSLNAQNLDTLNSKLNLQVNVQNNPNSKLTSQMSNKYSTLNLKFGDIEHYQDVEHVQNVKVVIDDGIKFVSNFRKNTLYDIIFVDAADSVEKSSDIYSCITADEIYGDKIITAPPYQFLQNVQFWDDVQNCLNNDNGILVVNVLGPMGYINSILKILQQNFEGIIGMQFLDDKQLYLFCSNNKQIQEIDIIDIIQEYSYSEQLFPVLFNQFVNKQDQIVKVYGSLGGPDSATELS
eukprot:TRINITY_DN30430_c0_g2_i5.p1 TRINITY_DN30430_c0_g2~~TRINITY_DN30430_c0_g2_i5.p1  ORF type:complete len:539 (-),score=62.16 TRINITY_DN30430_c0_g2_i5:130-1746(-)